MYHVGTNYDVYSYVLGARGDSDEKSPTSICDFLWEVFFSVHFSRMIKWSSGILQVVEGVASGEPLCTDM